MQHDLERPNRFSGLARCSESGQRPPRRPEIVSRAARLEAVPIGNGFVDNAAIEPQRTGDNFRLRMTVVTDPVSYGCIRKESLVKLPSYREVRVGEQMRIQRAPACDDGMIEIAVWKATSNADAAQQFVVQTQTEGAFLQFAKQPLVALTGEA